MPEEAILPFSTVERLRAEVAEARRRLEADLERRKTLLKALRELAKPDLLAQPPKLAARLKRLMARVAPEVWAEAGLEPLCARLEAWAQEGQRELRRELLRSLDEACRRRGLAVERRGGEDVLELRLPPLSVVLDFPQGRAVFRFAREPLAECPLDVERILKTYERTLGELEGKSPFDPDAFFRACLQAYRLVLWQRGGKEGDRVELLDFLPQLALAMQPRSFRRRLDRKTFRPYTRAHFAYDILRLRRAGGFVRRGLRLNLGVATGTSAYRKDRVVWCEDEHGRGEYKLTIFFTRTGNAG